MRTLNIKAFIIVLLTLGSSALLANAQLAFTAVDQVGLDGVPGSITANTDQIGSYNLTGGGFDTWDAGDSLTFASGQVSGDFDLRVRVESLELTDRWVKAGINARESLDSASRYAFQRVGPYGGAARHDGDGVNDNCFMYRTWLKDQNGSNGGQHEENFGPFSEFPWIRLQRVGNVFYGYASRDGRTWTDPKSQNTTNWAADPTVDAATVEKKPMAETLYVGLSVSSHWAGETALAEFRDFGSPNDPVQISRNPADTTATLVGHSGSAELSVGVAGGYDFVTLQWYKNDELIPGATNPTLKLSGVTAADSGATFYVAVSNTVNQSVATSTPATLSVAEDTTAPTVVSATSRGTPNWVAVKFSEAIDPTTIQYYNFFVDNNVGNPVKTFMGYSPDVVVIEVDGLSEDFTYNLDISGVADLAGNVVENTTVPFVMQGDKTFPLARIHFFKWTAIGDTSLDNMLNTPALYPDNPGFVLSNNVFEDPSTEDDNDVQGTNYIIRIFGIYNCDKTGDYKFYCASDDGSNVYLSSDDKPANKVRICYEPTWNGRRAYTTTDRRNADNPENQSVLIPLTAGRTYYLEQFMREGGGGNNASVAVRRPGGGIPAEPLAESAFLPTRYMDGYFFQSFGEARIGQAPASQSVREGTPATFVLRADGTPPYFIQWFRDGAPVAGATKDIFTTAPVDTTWNQAKFSVCVSNQFGGACSAPATLTVELDHIAPTLVGAEHSPDGAVLVYFSEPVAAASGANIANYSLQAGASTVAPDAAVILDDLATVKLTFAAPLTPDTTYTLTVKDIKDRALTPNLLTPNPASASFKTFLVSAQGYVLREWWYNVLGGGAVSALTADPRYPNSPDKAELTTTFNIDQTSPGIEYYGARMVGYIIPKKTGSYTFTWYSDDSGYLILSQNGQPAGVSRKVVEDTGCCATKYSDPVNLVAGKAYWAFAIFKEGTGGDYAHVQWKFNDGVDIYHYISSAEVYAGARLDSVTQPATQTVGENLPVTFNFLATGDSVEGLAKQWYSNDVAIAGATGWSYSMAITPLSANNAEYYCQLSISGQTVFQSAKAKLTVIEDTTAPSLAQIACVSSADALTFIFSEAVNNEGDAAVNPQNYSVSALDGAPVEWDGLAGVLSADGTSVTFKLATGTTYALDTDYNVEIYNLTDLAGLAVAPSTFVWRSCMPSPGWVKYEVYADPSTTNGTAVAALVANAKYPNSPDVQGYITSFNTRQFYGDDTHEYYGCRMRAFFIAPETGDYYFYTKSDDSAELWVGASFNTLALVASQTGCCNGNWADITSTAVAMEAGKAYAVQMLFKEGGGGDYGQVAVKLPSYTGDVNALPTIPSYLLGWVDSPNPAVKITLTQQPGDATICDQQTVTLQAAATISGTTLAPIYSWQKSTDSGVTWQRVTEATSVTTPALSPADSGLQYRCIVSVGPNYVISPTATITVVDAGAVLGAIPTFNMEKQSSLVQVGVLYSQAMSEDAVNPAMYTISEGIQVTAAAFDDLTQKKVTLQVSPMAKNTSYLLTVNPAVQCLNGAALCGASTATIKTPNGVAGIDFAQPVVLQGGAISGSAYTKDGVLHITDAVNSQQGGFYWDPFGPTTIKGFALSFNLRIGEGTCCNGTRYADGMSMSFANDLGDLSTFAAEEGTGTGVIVSFDTWDNNGTDTAPSLEVRSGGNTDANAKGFQSFEGIREGNRAYAGPLVIDPGTGEPMSMWTEGGAYAAFRMELAKDGTMNVSYKGVEILTGIQTGYVPMLGAKFLFSARTGGANENAWIKDLVIEEIYADAVEITLARDAANPTQVTLSWVLPEGATDGQLLAAPALDGPWEVVAGAASPYTTATTGAMKYFKVQFTPAP